jgi:hypothetical protein
MDERSAFDILLDYPKEKGFVYDTHQSTSRFYLITNDPISRTKYVVFKKDSLFFCAFDSYATKAYMTKTYTGIYKSIKLSEDIEFNIYKKDWLDSILRFNKIKTGLKHIDQYFTITSKSKRVPRELTEQTILLFQKIHEKIHPIQLIVRNDYIQIVDELKGKKVIGLETNQWIYKKEDIDILINLGGELIENIINACAQHRV